MRYKKKLLKRVINNVTWFTTYQHRHKLKRAAQNEAKRLRKAQGKIKPKTHRMHYRVLPSGKFWYVYYR